MPVAGVTVIRWTRGPEVGGALVGGAVIGADVGDGADGGRTTFELCPPHAASKTSDMTTKRLTRR